MNNSLFVVAMFVLGLMAFQVAFRRPILDAGIAISGVWGIFVLACSFTYADVSVSLVCLTIVVLLVLSVVVGGLSAAIVCSDFRPVSAISPFVTRIDAYAKRKLWRWFWVNWAMAWIAVGAHLNFLIDQVGGIDGAFSGAAYAFMVGGGELPGWLSTLGTFIYVTSLIGGVIGGCSKAPFGVATITFLPVLMLTFALTQKGLVTFSFLMYGSAFALTRYILHKPIVQFSFRSMIRLITILMIVAAIFVFTFLLRYGFSDVSALLEIAAKFRAYFLGSLYALSEWIGENPRLLPTQHDDWGLLTAGVLDLVGFRERQIGVYEQFVFFPDGWGTNVYTIFRAILTDFGLLLGSILVATLAFAYQVALFYVRKVWSPVLFSLLSAAMLSILWSPIVFPFTYNRITLAHVLFSMVLAHAISKPKLFWGRRLPTCVNGLGGRALMSEHFDVGGTTGCAAGGADSVAR